MIAESSMRPRGAVQEKEMTAALLENVEAGHDSSLSTLLSVFLPICCILECSIIGSRIAAMQTFLFIILVSLLRD